MTHASDDTTAHNLGISAAEHENEAKVIRIPITRRHEVINHMLVPQVKG